MRKIDTTDEHGIRWLLSRAGVSPDKLEGAAARVLDHDQRGRKRSERARVVRGVSADSSSRCPLTGTPRAAGRIVTDRDDSAERAALLAAALESAGLGELLPHLRAGETLAGAIRAAGLVERTAFRRVEELREQLTNRGI